MQNKISFLIPVHNEHKELDMLLTHLKPYVSNDDSILIQGDQGKVTDAVVSVVRSHMMKSDNISYIEYPLNGDFASFKNNLIIQSNGDYCFLIDADELPHPKLLENLHWLIDENPSVDVFWVPRMNIVKGLTPEYISEWGWTVNDFKVVDEDSKTILTKYRVKKDKVTLVNPFDGQQRLFKKTCRFEGKVHERLVGYDKYAGLPVKFGDEEYTFVWGIFHIKELERQIKQNELYKKL